MSACCSANVSLDGSATAGKLSGDLVDRPTCSAKPSGFGGTVRWRGLELFQPKDRGDVVPVGGAESAVPSCASVRIFGAEGQREAGKAGRATLAAKEGYLVERSAIGMISVGVRSGACRLV